MNQNSYNELGIEMQRRLESRIDIRKINDLCGVPIVVAGGALLAQEPNDYDVYAAYATNPIDRKSIVSEIRKRKWKLLGETPNAVTFKDDEGKIVQICSYAKDNPEELIASFDFAHCQVGISVFRDRVFGQTVQFHCTSNFIRAMALQRTFFVDTEYPASSLMRIVKYAKRGLYGDGRGYMPDMIRILTKLVDRGFRDQDDFRKQFDAIDLNLTGEEVKRLWDTCQTCLIKNSPVCDGFPF